MKVDQFKELTASIEGNASLRIPQREAYKEIESYFAGADGQREVGIVLPVGCGKSGLLAMAPFAVRSKRALIVAPNLAIAKQLLKDMNPSEFKYFYKVRHVLSSPPYPEVAEIRGTSTNVGDLEEADVVVTNIQQLQGEANKWMEQLDPDFFDLILFDEGHHNVAESWELLRKAFPSAKVVNVSATPARADGQRMAGEIIYTYPIIDAVRQGYVKHLSAHVLSPRTLRYVRREDGGEVTVDLAEVRRLGEVDASFRRSVVSSEESLTTIVDASVNKLNGMRNSTGEGRLKIIASALNIEHCKQIVAKYRERNLRADYVHSREDAKHNDAVYSKLEHHDLDVIVQVRKLGEGFDHPLLSVAAVFSVFANLSPFIQFVGRIMRVIEQNNTSSRLNHGVVVFHVGANVTGVWDDFKEFAQADQEWLTHFIEEIPERAGEELDRDPIARSSGESAQLPTIIGQEDVLLEDLALLDANPGIEEAIRTLQAAKLSPEQIVRLSTIPVSKQAHRRASRSLLDGRIKTEVGRMLGEQSVPHDGRVLDRTFRGLTNFQVVKASIDKRVNAMVDRGSGARREFTQTEIDTVMERIPEIVAAVRAELFDA